MASTLDTPRLLDKQIDRLYSLPLEAFMPARIELAKGLRASGDREGAARVRMQEKPTVAAWAVNQLARRKPKELRALFAAVDRVSLTAAATLEGAPAAEVRQSLAAERAALVALVEAAQEILEHEERRKRGVIERVESTLRVGASDPELRRVLKAGRLTAELEPRGTAPPATAPQERHPGRRREDAEERARAAHERMRTLQGEVRDLKLTVRAAEGRVRDAEREAERAHREAEEVRADLRRAQLELEAALHDAD